VPPRASSAARALALTWLAAPPLEEIVAWTSPGAWLVYTLAIVGLVALAAYPGQALFGIRFVPALLALAPMMVSAVGDFVLTRRRPPPELTLRIWNLLGTSAAQFFPLYVAATSRPLGTATFGAVFLLTAAYQGFMNRSALRQPPAALATPIAVAVAFAFVGGQALLPLLAFGIVGSGAAVIAGGLALDLDRRRRENDALRAAVQAQIDAERELAISHLRESMVAASGRTHDMGNQVQATALCVRAIETRLARLDPAHGRTEVAEAVEDLKYSVDALLQLVVDARADLRHARGRLVQTDHVHPVAALASALVTVGRRFPRVEFACTEGDPGVQAVLRGGQTALVRVLENLLANACEGDGARGAGRVECGVRLLAARGVVSVTIRDDGPGFSAGMLERGIEGLSSTKVGGAGLGLYTVERQLRASGGEIVLANRAEGGAEVVVLLPTGPEQPC
jgi:two-component system, NtrC family, C4-dicarboxylate transport sensor histidine kinase DctB